MKRIIKTIFIVLLILFLEFEGFSQVHTSDVIQRGNNTIYVAGNTHFYPLEYYNVKTKRYEGILPEMLEIIAKRSGINFVYIHSDSSNDTELEAELISTYVKGYKSDVIVDNIVAITYLSNGKNVNVGWAFTQLADKKFIETFKKEVKAFTPEEINNLFISHSKENAGKSSDIVVWSLFLLVIAALLIFFAVKTFKVGKQLQKNDLKDPETGIGNLLFFEDYYDKQIPFESRNQYYIAYIIVDSNCLQVYHGESSITNAIKYTANVFSTYTEHDEMSARISENSFVFAFSCTNPDVAESKMNQLLHKLSMYFDADKQNTKPVFHAAMYNLNSHYLTSEILLINLRQNCAGLLGTDEVLIKCDDHMINSVAEEKAILESIRKGLDNKEFKLYVQFCVENKTKKIVSAEALSRWENPEKGIIPPGKYIPIMDESGMIIEFDYYMFNLACIQLHKWHETEFGNITLSCNFTRTTLSEDNFMEKIKEISQRYVFDKTKLIIEITEDTLERNRVVAVNNILECKKYGFRIALDDLGSGNTSLINLCDYPIDIVKLDRNILLKTDKKSGADLFKGVIALTHSLNLKIVCEGVETEEHNSFVSSTDCDYIQGWYYSKVMPLRDGEEFARNYRLREI